MPLVPLGQSLPDDTRWTFATDGTGTLPPEEVVAVFLMIDYMGKAIASCNAATAPSP